MSAALKVESVVVLSTGVVLRRIGADLETHRIGPGAPFPRPVCATFAGSGDAASQRLVASGDPGGIEAALDGLLSWLEEETEGHGRRECVWHNGHGFDLPVLALHFPRYFPRIFAALEREQFRDTITREKLLNLAISGVVDHYYTPDGVSREINYRLETLVARYLGEDRAAEKGHDAEGKETRTDIWRLNFDSLDGAPSNLYPPDAREYATKDARDALLVCEAQDARAWEEFGRHGATGPDGKPFDVFKTEPLHVGAMFCLSLATYEGFGVDAAEVERMEALVAKARRPEQVALLFESGLLSRFLPARPYANGAVHSGDDSCSCAALSHVAGTPKMKAAETSHLSKKKLLEIVVKTWAANHLCDEDGCSNRGGECDRHGLPPLKRTEKSKTFPEGQISCDGEVVSDLASFDPVLDQYDRWTTVDKLVMLEIPRLRWALAEGGVIHGGFDEMKKTGRVSSRRSKFYPSINIQQIPRGFEIEEVGDDGKPVFDENGRTKTFKIEPRHAYVPRRSGWVFVSIDYSFIELVSHAQTMLRSVGYSVLAEKINNGWDPHAYLGAQLALGLDGDFDQFCDSLDVFQPDDVYQVFVKLKGGTPDEKKFYKRWRGFAKPTGLGYPGGLGAKTLVVVAKKMFGVEIPSIDYAEEFKWIWLRAFPENRDYLNRYVRDALRDPRRRDSEREKFAFWSPLGTYRSNCTFTEAANGFSLQGPSAEGMKLALWRLQRACWDETRGSCLYGCRVLAAIHDEAIIAMPEDAYLHERAQEAARLWIDGMRIICPDVAVKAEPAAMRRWDKNAEPVWSRSDRRLRVWSPDEDYDVDEEGRLWTA